MEFPFTCPVCQMIQMVDMECLIEKPVDKIRTSIGYICETCDEFRHLHYTTTSLKESFAKLKRYDIHHPEFRFRFAKTLKKALGVQTHG